MFSLINHVSEEREGFYFQGVCNRLLPDLIDDRHSDSGHIFGERLHER